MPTGCGLWHFLYRLVRKFIRSVVSSEKTWQLLAESGTGRHIIVMHFGNCDKANVVVYLDKPMWIATWLLLKAYRNSLTPYP